ncbi:MAG: DUF4876 domain-containing protein [Bacteroidales bacterium]|nr:DUF4876 domain-containing protein [Bacteroidales bacterium]
MKKLLILLSAAVLALSFAACEQLPKLVSVTVQLKYQGAALAEAGVPVSIVSDAGVRYESPTDASGVAAFQLPLGTYTASVTWKMAADGVYAVYNGSTSNVVAAAEGATAYTIDLQRVERQQIVIKELYFGGCTNPETSKGYTNDAYVILYNNSDVEADASDIVFCFSAPYNGNGTNKYYTDGKLSYENADWIPSYGAIWWFTSSVRIPAYSQVVVAIFGAIDHTQTVSTSVNLANSAYYWMSNSAINPPYTNAKYAAADVIPSANYLTCSPFTKGNAWAMSNSSPAFYIGRMSSSEAKALSENKDAYDQTLGTTEAMYVVKFPKAKVVDAVEVWSTANVAKSQVRFSADINTGYVAVTNNKGYTVYRNVDKEATEALAENAGKLVYDYAGGTTDVEGTTDPSNIDAEASIARGAHIIYSETNDTAKDFHQRKVASLKK